MSVAARTRAALPVSLPGGGWRQGALHLAAFLIPALSLALPSGYSWGAVLLLLLGFICLPQAVLGHAAWPRSLRWWALAVLLMGLAWLMHARVNGQWLWTTHGLDRAVKYGLALIALMAVVCTPLVSTAFLRWGCWAGAASTGVLGLWQWWERGGERASGFTNAIQFGNLALLLALWSWVWSRHETRRPALRWLGRGAALLGALACVASGSRGGWLVAPALVLLVLLIDRDPAAPGARGRLRSMLAACALVAGASTAVLLLPPVQERVALAVQEARDWQISGDADSSVGHRLEHWVMAWNIALEKPLLGWGQVAYEARMHELVEAGRVSPAVLHFNHAHHEWLDMWAKRGVVGVLALMFFFAVPAALYGRALRHRGLGAAAPHPAPQTALAVCGLLTVAGFVGFGLTQVMFAHNNANMVYLFMNTLWLAALEAGKHQALK